MKPNVESVRPPIMIKAGGRPSLARSTVTCTALVWRKIHVCSQSTFAQRTSHDLDEETVQQTLRNCATNKEGGGNFACDEPEIPLAG